MAGFGKVLNHPDKDFIIAELTSGTPVRELSEKLIVKYPKKAQEHLRISSSTLHNFKVEHLNLSGEILNAVKVASKTQRDLIKQEVVRSEVQNSSAYREAIEAMAVEQLDAKKEIIKLFTIIDSRMEYFYNRLAAGHIPEPREERIFLEYIDKFAKVLDSYKKYVDGFQETQNTNINVTVMTDQVSLIREAVREVLQETEPALAIKFMGKLNSKMDTLIYRADGQSAQSATDILISNTAVE